MQAAVVRGVGLDCVTTGRLQQQQPLAADNHRMHRLPCGNYIVNSIASIHHWMRVVSLY